MPLFTVWLSQQLLSCADELSKTVRHPASLLGSSHCCESRRRGEAHPRRRNLAPGPAVAPSMRHPAPLPLLLALIVGLGLAAGAGAAPTPAAWRHATPRRGFRSCLPVRRPVNDSTNFNEISSKTDIRWNHVSQSIPKREIYDEEDTTEKKNTSFHLMINPEDAPIKTWEDLKSKLMNEDFLGADARAEVIRILLPRKRNDTEEIKSHKFQGERKQKDKVLKSDTGYVLNVTERVVIMASTYAVVAMLAAILAWYAILQPNKKKFAALTQIRRSSKGDAPDKDELLRTGQNELPEASRVSIAADIITARTDAAEKAHTAAARAAEQTSASQPLTPVGARVADKMEVAEAVASKRKSRIRVQHSSSKVFGALPHRCKGIHLELGRSVIVLEGFKERDVPQRRHSIIGIVRPGETDAPPIDPRRSLPDMKTLQETADEEMARLNATVAVFQPLSETKEGSPTSDTALYNEAARSMNLMKQDSSATHSLTEQVSSGESLSRKKKPSVSISEEPLTSHVRKTSVDSPSSKNFKPPSLSPESQERRTSKTQHRSPFQRSRRGTLETVHSESIIVTPDSEAEAHTSDVSSSGSSSERSKRQTPPRVKQPPAIKMSPSTAGTSSSESGNDSESKLSIEGENRPVKLKRKDKAIKGALDQVEKLVDKITTPIVDTMRSAAQPKKKTRRSSQENILGSTLYGSKGSSPTKASKPKDKNEETSAEISSLGLQRLSEQKTVLPRLWGSNTTETEVSDSEVSKTKSPEDNFKRETSPPREDEDKSTEQKPVLPRLWNSTIENADDTSNKPSVQSFPLSKNVNDPSPSKSSKHPPKFLPASLLSKSPPKFDSKTKDTERTEKSHNKSIQDKTYKNTPDRMSDAQFPAYETTSGESISGKSARETERKNAPASTKMGHPSQSINAMTTKPDMSKASFRTSRHKFPVDKRHGNHKRYDGAHFLPVSQATLQAIFSRKSFTDRPISETIKLDLVKPEIDTTESKMPEGNISADHSMTDKYSDEASSSMDSAVTVGSAWIMGPDSDERMISSSSATNLSPQQSTEDRMDSGRKRLSSYKSITSTFKIKKSRKI